jgi:hypothetical protein
MAPAVPPHPNPNGGVEMPEAVDTRTVIFSSSRNGSVVRGEGCITAPSVDNSRLGWFCRAGGGRVLPINPEPQSSRGRLDHRHPLGERTAGGMLCR